MNKITPLGKQDDEIQRILYEIIAKRGLSNDIKANLLIAESKNNYSPGLMEEYLMNSRGKHSSLER